MEGCEEETVAGVPIGLAQVLEYFDAHLIGLIALPSKQPSASSIKTLSWIQAGHGRRRQRQLRRVRIRIAITAGRSKVEADVYVQRSENNPQTLSH